MKNIFLIIFIVFSFSIQASELAGDKIILMLKQPIEKTKALSNIQSSILGSNLTPILPESYIFRKDEKIANSPFPELLIESLEKLERMYLLTIPETTDIKTFAKTIEQGMFEIEIAEPYSFSEIQSYTPNDPLVSNQLQLNSINAYEAWDIEKGNPNVVIGISDNGINQSHEDLKNNIKINEDETINGKDDDGNGYIDDYNGFNFDGVVTGQYSNTSISDNHGTQVAGIASAHFDNDIGIAGVGGRCTFFPLKVGSNRGNSSTIVYGYLSIIYAAVVGLDVINCSWGTNKPYSLLEQTIIDFAVANDVAIVTSSGNLKGGMETDTKFYPAGYKGVLGVGESTHFDLVYSSSSLGTHCHILAPGINNYTTNISGAYNNVSSGTSFASPVVAGALGLIRSKYPELNALQTIVFARQATADITANQTFFQKITPGRIDLLKAVTIDPFSIPGFYLEGVKYFKNGNEVNRVLTGDTVDIEIELTNLLGDANNFTFLLELALPDFQSPVSFLDNLIEHETFKSMERKSLRFKMIVSEEYSEKAILRLNIIEDNSEYLDFILFDFFPNSSLTTFENEAISFSISDKGKIGYESLADERIGIGFNLKEYGGGLYEAFLFTVLNDNLVFNSDQSGYYTVDKPFHNPSNTAILRTINDIIIEQEVVLTKGNYPFVKLINRITNASNEKHQISFGYKFDWDIGADGEYENNFTELLDFSKQVGANPKRFIGIYTGNPDQNTVFGTSINSENIDAEFRVFGATSSINFNNSRIISIMNVSDFTVTPEIDDIYNVIGMRFKDEFELNETKVCEICIGAGFSTEELIESLTLCHKGINNVEDSANLQEIIYDNSSNTLYINDSVLNSLSVYGINGDLTFYSEQSGPWNLSHLRSGAYFVKAELENTIRFKKILINN